MKIGTVLLAITLLLYKVQGQICGPPILPPAPSHPPMYPNPPLIPPVTPVVGTTIIDTSLSSALANVLQLLIVSDLIESTLNTALGHHSVPVAPICEPVPQPIPIYTPTVEVSPITEFVSQPCSPIIDYVPSRGPKVDILPRNPVIDYLPSCAIDYKPPCLPSFDFIPQYGVGPIVEYSPPCPTFIDLKPPCPPSFEFAQFGPVIDYLPAPVDFSPPCTPVFDMVPQYGPVIDYIPQSGPIFDFAPPCATFIEPLPNFYGECITPTPVNIPTNNYCGFTEFVTPMYGMPEIIGPVQLAPTVPNCYNGVSEVIGPRVTVGPVATEFLYPTNVPAQMTCNIGNIPSLPFVSVDPIPCGCGYNNVGNTYFY
ncbi:PREDICTED: leucine-rich repeat extensin-like protein 5 [Papilio xuthus]|uniref:Leucine-rich repeat extensin-like protein 5 n=1 Tax=Papilio xuthus TaxID=66420 RepID=A0AAJ6ZMB7_PAPXU|nr:PREDICTED: leucine-rich repeat extensin-like protein 5 [Papilio xuthus]